MKLHLYVSREAAIAARKSRHGQMTIDVDNAWLEALGPDELVALQHLGTEEQPIGRPRYSSVYYTHNATLAEGTPEAAARWITETLGNKKQDEAEKVAAHERKVVEGLAAWRAKAEEMLSTTPRDLVRHVTSTGYDVPPIPHDYRLEHHEAKDQMPELYGRVVALVAAAKDVGESMMREKAGQKAEQKRRHDEERIAWIAKHGSAHLRDLVEHNYPYAATYRDERRTSELDAGGTLTWVSYDEICGGLRDIRDPSPEALAALKAARKRYEGTDYSTFAAGDIQLQWWCDGQHVDGCGDGPGNDECEIEPRPVLTVWYMGNTYICDFTRTAAAIQ